MAKYLVEKQIDGQWYPEGTWTDPCHLAKAMFELGLGRPDYESIRVTEMQEPVVVSIEVNSVGYLMRTCNVSRKVALIALERNGGSVVHAHADLLDYTTADMYAREAQNNGGR